MRNMSRLGFGVLGQIQAAAASGGITFVDGQVDSAALGTDITVDISAASSGDFALCFMFSKDRLNGFSTATSGWTELEDLNGKVAGDTAQRSGVYYKVLGASETNPTFSHGAPTGTWGVITLIFRGVDNSTPFDTTYAQASHWDDGLGATDATPTAPSITTASANSCIVVFGGWLLATISDAISPSGYTDGPELISSNANMGSGYLLDAGAAGAKSPGDWQNTNSGDVQYSVFTFALKAA